MKLPLILGVKVLLGAGSRFQNRRKFPYEVFLDEKPLGQLMKPRWQRCIVLRGELDLDHIDEFVRKIEDCLVTDAILAAEAGFVIEAETGGIRTRRIPDDALHSVSHCIAQALSYISTI